MRSTLILTAMLLTPLLLLAACGGEPAEEATTESKEEPAAEPAPASGTTAQTEAKTQTTAPKVPADVPEQLLGTRWELVELEGKPVSKGMDGKELYIQLNASGNAVSGFAGCNSFTGSFHLDRTRLSFGPLAATRMACPGEGNPEQQFLKVLGAVELFDITPNRLALSTERSHGVAKFVAAGSH